MRIVDIVRRGRRRVWRRSKIKSKEIINNTNGYLFVTKMDFVQNTNNSSNGLSMIKKFYLSEGERPIGFNLYLKTLENWLTTI